MKVLSTYLPILFSRMLAVFFALAYDQGDFKIVLKDLCSTHTQTQSIYMYYNRQTVMCVFYKVNNKD